MDGRTDPLRRERAELLARSEEVRRWARLVRAQTDLLVAQLCPPAGGDGSTGAGPDDLAALVLGAGGAAGTPPHNRAERLLALREARRVLRRQEEELADRLSWSTAHLVLEGPVPAGRRPATPPGAAPGAAPTPAPGRPRPRSTDAPVLRIPRPRAVPAVTAPTDVLPVPTCPTGTPAPTGGWHTPA